MTLPRSLARLASAVVVASLLGLLGAPAPAVADITYIYDALGRLRAVVDPASDTAVYSYDAVGNLLSISRQNSAIVSVIDFSPASGPIGTTVTISGTGFSPTASQNTVTFNGTAATVISATPTQVVATVPTGATSGAIVVTAPGGSGSSAAPFTVTGPSGPPTITGFTPAIGVPSTAVSVTGTNFDPTPAYDKLKVNIAYTPVSAATATTLSTTVPTGTGSGRLSVSTPTGMATSTADFFVPPSPFTAADVQVTGRMSTDGTSQTVSITTPNKIGLIVFDGSAGQGLTLQMTGVTIASTGVAIRHPNGALLTQTTVGTSGGSLSTTLTRSGTHTILVDPVGTNTGSITLTFRTADLVPTALTGPASASTQQAISVSWTVANQGNATPSSGWYDHLYLSTAPVCCTGATFIQPQFANPSIPTPGGSYTQTKTITVPGVPPGNYYLIVNVDGNGAVFEGSETNNQRAVPITISTPDLTPTALTAPASVVTQQAISVSWTVANQGNATPSSGWYDHLYLSTDSVCCSGDTLIQVFANPSVPGPGGSYSQTKTITVPNVAAGNYYLILKTDGGGAVYEVDETNNERAIPITISRPDLTPTAFTGPASAVTQQAISLSWTITNQGTGTPAVSWYDNIYLSTDTVCCTGDTLIQLYGNPSAPGPGGSYTQTKTITIPNVVAGNYYLIVKTDGSGNLYEDDETNNQRAIPIAISTPDLTPTALTAPASAAKQQQISISWTVANQGTGTPTLGWSDYLYLSTDTACCTGDTLIQGFTNPSVPGPGGSYSQTKTITVPNVAAGNYYLILKTDGAGALYEADETNNLRSVPITITP